MAAAVSVMAREYKIQMPIYQVLVYPIADDNVETASYVENAKAKPLDRAGMQWFFKQYLNSPAN
jgi:acetyl esterase/lipase